MAGKNSNENKNNNVRHKLSKKLQIMHLAGYVVGNLNYRIPGLTNHIDEIGNESNRHLCHIIKVFSMGGFQIETFKELKQLVSNIEPGNNEIFIQEKFKNCYQVADKLEKEITDYNLYDVLFKVNNSVDEEKELLSFINEYWNGNIEEWKEHVYKCMKNGKVKPNTWTKWYILRVAEKQGISDDIIKEWSNLMDKAYEWRCSAEKAGIKYDICNCLLFEMQSSDESKKLKHDLQWKLREESDAYNPPDNLPDDYFLIKSGIIKSLNEFIEIMQLCIDNKIYLYLSMSRFRETVIKRLIGEAEFFKMLESATSEQIEKILNIDVKMDKIVVWSTTFEEFLINSHNSKAVEKIIACTPKDETSFSAIFSNPGANLHWFKWNHLQISVETFEKFVSSCSAGSLWHIGSDMNFVDVLSIGLKCCSADMKTNGKKIDLGHIFLNWVAFCKVMHEKNLSSVYSGSIYVAFLNFVFKNIDKINLNAEQITGFLFGEYYDEYGDKKDNFTETLCYYTQGEGAQLYPNNELAKTAAIVINAILKKQNLKHEGHSIQKMFEVKCKKIGINISCDQDDIFCSYKMLYVVDKDTEINQFSGMLDFFEYVYENINTEKGQRYAALLGNYICKCDNFSILYYSDISYHYFETNYRRIVSLMLNVLKNHNEALAKVKEEYVKPLGSKWGWKRFCLLLYFFFVFPFVSRANVSISTVALNNNQNVTSENKTENSETPAVIESTNELNIGS